MKLVGCYNKSVILSFIGVMSAIFGLCNISNIKVVLFCIILSGLCDLFDGYIARKCKRNDVEIAFGVQIDSLCDVVCSVVFPIVFFISYCELNKIIVFIVSCLFVIAGLERLGWFNISRDIVLNVYGSDIEKENMKGYFEGLPVTYVSLIIPLIFIIFSKLSCFSVILMCSYLIISLLFILKFKLKKPTGLWYGFFILLAFVMCLCIVFLL